MNPISGLSEWIICRLPFLIANVVKEETAENSTDEATCHIHAKLNENIKHINTSLLKRKLTAVRGAAMMKLCQKKICAFNI